MAKNGAKDRYENSRALTKGQVRDAALLVNSPKAVRDAIELSSAEKAKAQKAVEKQKTLYERMVESSKNFQNDETKLEVLGGIGGQAFHEGVNWLVFRNLADWSKRTAGEDGFWASNVDITQSIPGALATVVYVLEKALRDNINPEDAGKPKELQRPYVPSSWRRGLSEAAKIAGHLGFSNTVRALRFRWAESSDEALEKNEELKSMRRMLQAAKDELEAANAKVREIQGGGAAGGGAAGGGGASQ